MKKFKKLDRNTQIKKKYSDTYNFRALLILILKMKSEIKVSEKDYLTCK